MDRERDHDGAARAAITAGAAGAVLWLVVGVLGAAASWSSALSRYAPVRDVLLPPTVPLGTVQQVAPWNIVQPTLVALVFGALLTLGTVLLARRAGWSAASRVLRAASVWLVVVLAADVTAFVWLVGAAVVEPGPNGYMWVLRDAVPSAVATAWFGAVWGWVPAIVVAGTRSRPRDSEPDDDPEPDADGDGAVRGRWTTVVSALTALVLAVVLVAVQPTITRDARIAAGGTPDGLPTETVTPTPRPTSPPLVAPDAVVPDADWCTSADVQLALSGVDGALGHRAMTIVLVNRSSDPCVVDGFPDVAFAAEDGATVPVPVEQGASYLGGAATPTPLTVAPGSTVDAALEWGAGGTGEAVATFWTAPWPGAERTPLTADTDLAADATVTVGAWAAPGTSTDQG